MTREEAVSKYHSGWWESATDAEIVEFQLYEERLCMPLARFQAAVEKVLGRAVFTHEYADWQQLQAEHQQHK